MNKLSSQNRIFLVILAWALNSCSDHSVPEFRCPEIVTEEVIVGMNFVTQFELKFNAPDNEVEEYGIVISRTSLTEPDVDNHDAMYKRTSTPLPSPYRITVEHLSEIPHQNYSFYYRGYVRFKGITQPCYGSIMYFYLRV